MSKFDITVMDNDTIRDAFEESFKAQVDDTSNDLEIGEIDVEVERGSQDRDVTATVTVYSMAEHTPRNGVHNPATGHIAKGAKTIRVVVEGRGEASFGLVTSRDRSTNDYDLVYSLRK
jgi:hypothetical protein